MNRHFRNVERGEATSKRREKGSSGGCEGSRDEEEEWRVKKRGEEQGREFNLPKQNSLNTWGFKA